MNKTVIFNELGFPVSEAPPPPANHVVVPAATPLRNEAGQWLAPDGSYRWNLIGQPAYGGLDGREALTIPSRAELIGLSWADLEARRSDEHPFGWRKEPRPETAAEKRAREKAEADAAVAEARAQINALSVSDVQFAAACARKGLITETEALTWAGGGAVPAVLDAALAQLPAEQQFMARLQVVGAKQYNRASPLVAGLGHLMGITEAELDQLFVAAAAL